MEPQTKQHVIGSRVYPCSAYHREARAQRVHVEGVYSRQCPRCGTYWVLHVEPSVLADRMPGLLKMRWATS